MSLFIAGQAQVSKTVYVTTAGRLSAAFTATEKTTVTNLTITGTIDARDFKFMRDSLAHLNILDISNISITAYSGTGGTSTTLNDTYSAKSIPVYAFSNSDLRSIALGNGIEKIGEGAFFAAINLSGTLIITSSVISIGNYAFSGCNLVFLVDSSNQYYSSEDGVLFDKGKNSLIQCPQSISGSYLISSTVNTISPYAFVNCNKISSITIPSSVIKIGESAFQNCSSLRTFFLNIDVPINITSYNYIFEGVNNNTCLLIVPDGSKNSYKNANGWKSFKNIIYNSEYITKKTIICSEGLLASQFGHLQMQITKDLTVSGTIDARDFKFMRDSLVALENLDLSGVTISAYIGTFGTASTTSTKYSANEIPQKAFYTSNGNAHLTKVIFPTTATAIASYAFSNCTGLTNVNTASSMNIMGYAFSNCTGLTSATISYGNNNIFTGCMNLATIYIPNGLTSIGYEAFKDLKTIKKVIIPNTVTGIDDYAFSGCVLLDSISIPASIISVGDWSFAECGVVTVDEANTNFCSVDGVLFNKTKKVLFHAPISLINYIIPSTVTTIKNAAFYNNINLKNITIPASVLSIGEYAFAYCEKLAGVSFPSAILIGKFAFYGCYGLSEIVIPTSVSTIGKCAFFECVNITSIKAMSSTPIELEAIIASEDNDVFGGIDKTSCILYVPKGSKALYKVANQWKDFLVIAELDGTALPSLFDAKITLYPNPFVDSFRFKGIEGSATLHMTDLNGRDVLNRQVTDNESVSVGLLPKGMFIVKLKTTEGTFETKLIKK